MSVPAVDAAPTGFGELVARHERDVLRITRAVLRDEHLGADAAQETFVRLWRRMGRLAGRTLPAAGGWGRGGF